MTSGTKDPSLSDLVRGLPGPDPAQCRLVRVMVKITTLRGRSGIISNTPSEPEEGLEYLEKVATPPWPWRAVLVFSGGVGAVGDSAEADGTGVFGGVFIGRVRWRSSRPDEVCRRARSALDVISASRAGMMSNLGLQVRHGCLDILQGHGGCGTRTSIGVLTRVLADVVMAIVATSRREWRRHGGTDAWAIRGGLPCDHSNRCGGPRDRKLLPKSIGTLSGFGLGFGEHR